MSTDRVGDVNIKAVVSTGGAENKLKDVAGALDRVGESARKAGGDVGDTSQFDRAGKALQRLREIARATKQALDDLRVSGRSAGSGFGLPMMDANAAAEAAEIARQQADFRKRLARASASASGSQFQVNQGPGRNPSGPPAAIFYGSPPPGRTGTVPPPPLPDYGPPVRPMPGDPNPPGILRNPQYYATPPQFLINGPSPDPAYGRLNQARQDAQAHQAFFAGMRAWQESQPQPVGPPPVDPMMGRLGAFSQRDRVGREAEAAQIAEKDLRARQEYVRIMVNLGAQRQKELDDVRNRAAEEEFYYERQKNDPNFVGPLRPPMIANQLRAAENAAVEMEQASYEMNRDRLIKESQERIARERRDSAERMVQTASSLADQRQNALKDIENRRAAERYDFAGGIGQTLGQRIRGGLFDTYYAGRDFLARRVNNNRRPGQSEAEVPDSIDRPSNLISRTVGDLSRGAATRTIGAIRGMFSGIVGGVLSFTRLVLADLAGRMISSVVGQAGALAQKAFTAARDYEDVVTSYGVITGSPTQGKALVDRIQKLAIETPFRMSELLAEGRTLMSYGIRPNDTPRVLTQLGDIASGTGTDIGRLSLAYGQVIAKGRLQGGELRQLTEAGVGLEDLVSSGREVLGRPGLNNRQFLKMMEDGEISSRVVERAFERMTSAGGRFFGMMDARSKTVGGRLNALAESVELIAQRVGKSLFDRLGIGEGLDDLVKTVSSFDMRGVDSVIEREAPGVRDFAAKTFAGIKAIFGDGVDVRGFGDGLRSIAEDVFPKIISFGEVLINFAGVIGEVAGMLLDYVAKKVGDAGGAANALDSAGRATATYGGAYVGANYGFEAGAAIGTAIAPGVGTVIGAGIGTVVGTIGGAIGGRYLYNEGSSAVGLSQAAEDAVAAQDPLTRIRRQIADTNAAERFRRAARAAKAGPLRQQDAERRLRDKIIGDYVRGANDLPGTAGGQDFVRGNPFRLDPNRLGGDDPDGDLVKYFTGRRMLKQYDRMTGFDFNRRTRLPVMPGLAGGIANAAGSLVDASGTKYTGLPFDREFRFLGKAAEGVSQTFGNLKNVLLDVGQTISGDFQTRMERLADLAGQPKFDPLGDLEKDRKVLELMRSPLMRMAGLGLNNEEFGRAMGERAQEFVEKFGKSKAFEPAPLIRSGTQEAESALVKAIYADRNNKKPEEELKDAMINAKDATVKNSERLRELREAFEKLSGDDKIGVAGFD